MACGFLWPLENSHWEISQCLLAAETENITCR
jgi:hypothetical protein